LLLLHIISECLLPLLDVLGYERLLRRYDCSWLRLGVGGNCVDLALLQIGQAIGVQDRYLWGGRAASR
jgi:hypothetical protein